MSIKEYGYRFEEKGIVKAESEEEAKKKAQAEIKKALGSVIVWER